MKLRSLFAAFSTVVATAGVLVVSGAAPASAAGSACPSSDPVPSVTSGTVTPFVQHWWSLTTSTPKTVTMLETSGDPDLIVTNASCSAVCYPYTAGSPEVCHVGAGTYYVGVKYFYGPNGQASYALHVASPQCSDGIDNDRDGKIDYPADQGCADAADNSEGVTCQTVSGSVVCAGISSGAVFRDVEVLAPGLEPGPEHVVVGYLQDYFFDGTAAVTVPCVDLVVDGRRTSACASGGGDAVGQGSVLVQARAAEHRLVWRTVRVARVCHAEVQATVDGRGLNSLAAYTVC